MSESLDFFQINGVIDKKLQIASAVICYVVVYFLFYISLQKSLPSILQFLLLSLKSQSVVFGKVHLKISTVSA